jgi:hypothetical protein
VLAFQRLIEVEPRSGCRPSLALRHRMICTYLSGLLQIA